MTTQTAPEATVYPEIDTDRNATIERIRKALKERSGKTWSVTGGRGTAWGWIRIKSPPRRCVDDSMTEAEQAELSALLGGARAYENGVDVAASSEYRREYVDRAEGREPRAIAQPYWD